MESSEEQVDKLVDLFEFPLKLGHGRSTSEYSRAPIKTDIDPKIRKQSSSSSLNFVSFLMNKITGEPKSEDNLTAVWVEGPKRTKTVCHEDATKFTVQELVGKGNIGVVFRVSHKHKPGINYAVKLVSKTVLKSKSKEKRVLAELNALASLHHPFISKLFHTFQDERCVYFVLQHYNYGFLDLMKHYDAKFRKESIVKYYGGEILLALEYIHSKGFIYRDLKPENILLSDEGHIVLTDFDMSKNVPEEYNLFEVQKRVSIVSLIPFKSSRPGSSDRNQSKTSLYRTNSIIGTNEYLAPEVILGEGHNGSVDWWSYGILLYEMTFGKTPFSSGNHQETYQMILNQEPSFDQGPGEMIISTELKNLIQRLLIKSPTKRLGCTLGSIEIKKHKFFEGFDLNTLYKSSPPLSVINLTRRNLGVDEFRSKSLKEVVCETFQPFEVQDGPDPFSEFESASFEEQQL